MIPTTEKLVIDLDCKSKSADVEEIEILHFFLRLNLPLVL